MLQWAYSAKEQQAIYTKEDILTHCNFYACLSMRLH